MGRYEVLVDGVWVWAGSAGPDAPPPPPPVQYLALPGVSGAVARVSPDSGLDLTGSCRMLWTVRKANWRPAVQQVMVAKWGSDGGCAWYAATNPNGGAHFRYSPTGLVTNAVYIDTAAVAETPNGQVVFVEDVYTAGNRQLSRRWAPDSATPQWSAAAVSTTGTHAAFDVNDVGMSIGSIADGGYRNLEADVFQLVIYDASGAVAFTLDPDRWVSGPSWQTATGHTVTLAGTASIQSE